MKENNKIVCFRSFVASCLMFAVFAASSMVVFAMPDSKSAAGELIVSGRNTGAGAPFAMLNGERAFSGRTFFSSSTIATSEDNDATVKLGKLGSIDLAPNSILSLNFGDNKISGNLIAGQIKVFSSEGVDVKIQTSNQVVANDAAQNNVFTVDVRTGATDAVAETGSVRLNNGEAVVPTQTGQTTGSSGQTTGSSASTDSNSYLGPLIIFAGVVAVAAVFVIRHNDKGTLTVSPTR